VVTRALRQGLVLFPYLHQEPVAVHNRGPAVVKSHVPRPRQCWLSTTTRHSLVSDLLPPQRRASGIMASEAGMDTRTGQRRVIWPMSFACRLRQHHRFRRAKDSRRLRASLDRAKTVRPRRLSQHRSISPGWKRARRGTRRISRLERRRSSTAVCETSFCKGKHFGPLRFDQALIIASAAQAWNRSDSRAAKALSLRGQSENNLMREAHREAARILYEERNKGNDDSRELYVDLHGM
jgi:hypothetical protein